MTNAPRKKRWQGKLPPLVVEEHLEAWGDGSSHSLTSGPFHRLAFTMTRAEFARHLIELLAVEDKIKAERRAS